MLNYWVIVPIAILSFLLSNTSWYWRNYKHDRMRRDMYRSGKRSRMRKDPIEIFWFKNQDWIKITAVVTAIYIMFTIFQEVN